MEEKEKCINVGAGAWQPLPIREILEHCISLISADAVEKKAVCTTGLPGQFQIKTEHKNRSFDPPWRFLRFLLLSKGLFHFFPNQVFNSL